MSLLSSLNTAASALQVFSTALGAEQINVSNSATAGFAAIRASINGVGPSPSGSDFIQIQSTGSLHADAVVQSATSQSSYSAAGENRLGPVNQLFDITGNSGILAALQKFSTAFSSLSVSPGDATLRSTALAAASGVAVEFRKAAASLDSQKADVDAAVQSTVSSINRLAGQIRQLNVATRGRAEVDPGTDAELRSSLDQLAALTDISVLKNADGTVSVLTGGQQPLVIEDQAYALTADLQAAPGSQITSSGGGSSPAGYSGQLGALLDFRNNTIQSLTGGNGQNGSLNDLAKGFAARVNTLLTGGLDPSGNAGVPIYTYDQVNNTNVARTLAVDPTVTPAQLALATGAPSPQSNGIAIQLAGLLSSLQPADQINGTSAQSLFASIAAGVGQKLSDAREQSSADATALTTAQVSRQKISGVSLDQEALAITSLQRSYEASAKIVSILDQLTSDEVNLIR